MNLNANNRIPSLDGLRTISVLFVVASHFLYTQGFGDYFNLGILGVKFFFVISGVLITGLLLKEIDKTSTISLPKFYFRRTLRIFPPYYFYLFVIFLASYFGILNIRGESFIAPLTYTSNYINVDSWHLLHTWSLSVEEQFYLIYPFVLLFLGRKKIVWVLAGLVIVSPFLRLIDYQTFSESGKMWIYYGFHANADGLAVGCLLAIFYERLHQSRVYLKLLNSPLIFVVPIVLIFVNSTIDPREFYLGISFTISNFLAAICIDWAITNYNENAFGKFLNTAPMEKIGVMSYSIYLWQQPFLDRSEPQWFNLFPYNFIGIAIFSLISYYLIESTSLGWRQRIEMKLFQSKTSQNS
jgi:peptidoglycan/LPS O-acetylase OafA/YrhL